MTANDLQAYLADLGDPVRAAHCQRFFKTGPGEYGEGDIFRGIPVPKLRQLARSWRQVPLHEMKLLLQSPYHEDRFTALCLLIHAFQHGVQDEVYQAYVKYFSFVDNWDLVDISCHKILGPYLFERPRLLLYTFAQSTNLWERRCAIVTTYYFIKRNQFMDTLALVDFLSNDSVDLIHKACGWMLREVGKRDESLLIEFLDYPGVTLPRTTLRYAIERLPAKVRKSYLDANPKASFSYYTPNWRAYRYVMNAAERLKGNVIKTPVLASRSLANLNRGEVFLKLENHQHTGSFKYRGALNKLLTLNRSSSSVTLASTGNHGLATSQILKEFNLPGTTYVPSTADKQKVETLRGSGMKVIFHGTDGIHAELEARREAEHTGQEFISPYNDWQVIAGQGTVGLEILEQLGPLDFVFIAVGGGGLISGIALALKNSPPRDHHRWMLAD